MSVAVRRSKTVKYYDIHVDSSKGDNVLIEKEKTLDENPFLNLLDLVEFYYSIYATKDIEKLKDFVSLPWGDRKGRIISILAMHGFVGWDMYLGSFDPEDNDDWMNFDTNALDELIKNSFFDEYNRSLPTLKRCCRRPYPMLDVYAFFRLQAYATTVLPMELLWDVNYIWTFHDFIDCISGLGWFEIITTVYKSYGIHWFAHNGEKDPIMYKWACYAVAACKKTGSVSDDDLKRDLDTIYQELLIAFTIRGTREENSDIIEYVKECRNNFDEDRINKLIDTVKTLEEQKGQLVNENKQLNEGLILLRSQIKELQAYEEKPDFDKIEEMAYRIYCLSPQTSEFDERVKQFTVIWGKLDESTKKDIKLSISMFERFESFDLALFPMIRSLEHEFARNFFSPFYHSKSYEKAFPPECKEKRYEKTHDALIRKNNIHPTIGNIPFIGRAMKDAKAQEASNLIKAFKIFLGDERSAFISICKDLDTYKLGTQQYKLVDIRNGIAHGDDSVTQNVDKKCYEEVSKMLYEPPLQILFKVIDHSLA